MESLIEYMYTGKISLTQSNAVDIIKASDMFELTAVKNTTLKFIEDYISFDVSATLLHNFSPSKRVQGKVASNPLLYFLELC